MFIKIKWQCVLFTALFIFATTVLIQYHFSPSIYQYVTFSHTRRLMNENSCKNLEEQVERMKNLFHTEQNEYSKMFDRLRAQISDSRRKLDDQYEIVRDLERRNRQLIEKMTGLKHGTRRREQDYRLAPMIKPETLRSLNIHQKNEFQVIPFTAFTKDRQYTLESGMINKPEVAPIGNKKLEHDDIITKSLEVLNNKNDQRGRSYNKWDLAQGYYRIDHMMGTEYELYFKSKEMMNVFEHVQVFRPFAPLQVVEVLSYSKENEWINLVVSLSGRVETFKEFMKMFTEECIKKDKRVYLTIVYFGEEKKEEVKSILMKTAMKHNYEKYKFIERTSSFSRGVGLLAGAEAWIDGNVLLFFCDVDVIFKPGFLDRCRLNAAPGSKVYYPIVFSLYNPSIVYSDQGELPAWNEQLLLNRNTGFWRTFGFGMTCMYRSDFLFMRGFDTNIQGWGMEDVMLYRKIAQSNLNIVRSPDPGIFHMWHEKKCDPHLPSAQYNMCLGSKALGEASHAQLGMLAFSDLKKENELLHEEDVGVNEGPDLRQGELSDSDGDQENEDLEQEDVMY